jgi:hypothetical protein
VEKENHRKMIRDFVERKNSGAHPSRTEIAQERMCNKKTTHENGLFTRDRDGYRKEEEATRDLLNYNGCGDGQNPPENLLGQIRQFFTAHQNSSDARCGTTSDTSGEGKQNPARTSSLHRSQ